ncbi:Uncharacterised protein [uncultured archaeon]|nr:Uncharacterised protein [uncultured archaeon]
MLLLAGCAQGGAAGQKTSAKAHLIELLDLQQNSTWMVNRTYYLTNSQVVYFKNSSNIRADVGFQTAYVLNGTTYYCMEAGGAYSCHMAQADDQTLRALVRNSIFFLNRDDVEAMDEADVSALPNLQVAGVQASCFNVPKGDLAGVINDTQLMKTYLARLNGSITEYCFAPDGAPLLKQFIYNQTTWVWSQATQYSNQVRDEDLSLPGPVEN